MIIDNGKEVIKYRKIQYLLPFSIIAIICLFLFTNWFIQPLLGLDRMYYVYFFIIIYILFIAYFYFRNYYYIMYSDESDKLTFKFFSLGVFSSKHKTIEISKNTFVNYKIQVSMMGIKEELILQQRVGNKIAKYPPLSISILTKEEKKDLITSLDSFLEKK